MVLKVEVTIRQSDSIFIKPSKSKPIKCQALLKPFKDKSLVGIPAFIPSLHHTTAVSEYAQSRPNKKSRLRMCSLASKPAMMYYLSDEELYQEDHSFSIMSLSNLAAISSHSFSIWSAFFMVSFLKVSSVTPGILMRML